MQMIAKQKIIFMLGVFFVLSIGIYLAQWKWHFFSAMTMQNNSSIKSNAINNPPNYAEKNRFDNSADIRAILAANLFGQAGVIEKGAELVQKTQQPLELHGIVFIPHHPEQAVAVIAKSGAEAKDYKTGDEILPFLPGWKVHTILSNAVKLEHDGILELLELSENLAQAGNAQPPNNPAIQFDNAVPPQDSLPPAPESLPPVPDNSQPLPPPENQVSPQPENAQVSENPPATTSAEAGNTSN